MIEGVIHATKAIICSHSRARIERLIASDQTPLLIGSLVNKCKIACPHQYNLAEEFMHKLHFLTQRHSERTSVLQIRAVTSAK